MMMRWKNAQHAQMVQIKRLQRSVEEKEKLKREEIEHKQDHKFAEKQNTLQQIIFKEKSFQSFVQTMMSLPNFQNWQINIATLAEESVRAQVHAEEDAYKTSYQTVKEQQPFYRGL